MKSAYSIVHRMIDFSRLCSGRVPGQLVIQFTDHCNAACPQCDMNVNHAYPRHRLDQERIKKIITQAASCGFRSLSFTGGEPFLYYKDLLQLIHYACEHRIPYIRTGTNGFFLRNQDNLKIETMAQELACSGLRNLWISIDSADTVLHEEIRGLPGVIEGIRRALPVFHACGLYPAANLGINRLLGGPPDDSLNNKPERFYESMISALDRFFKFVIELGFTMANVCYPMGADLSEEHSLHPVYGAHSPHFMVEFTREEKIQIFRALQSVIPRYRSRIRIFTPLSSLYALEKQLGPDPEFSFPCRGGIDFFFVSARDAMVYPCGYRGQECLGSFPDLKRGQQFNCRLCEWECFRDPSELISPLMIALQHPGKLLSKFSQNKTYARLWWSDLHYYRACRFFNGRLSPESSRVAGFMRMEFSH